MGTTAINLSQEVPGKNITEYLFDADSLKKFQMGSHKAETFRFKHEKTSWLFQRFFLCLASKMINVRH